MINLEIETHLTTMVRRRHVLWTIKIRVRIPRIQAMMTPLDVRLLKIIMIIENYKIEPPGNHRQPKE